jgi:tetratricopeptide (TPR) repeat protein
MIVSSVISSVLFVNFALNTGGGSNGYKRKLLFFRGVGKPSGLNSSSLVTETDNDILGFDKSGRVNQMKFLGIFILLLSIEGFSQSGNESLIRKLDSVIAQRENIQKEKLQRIQELKHELRGKNLKERFALNTEIYNEYKSFIYDSAFRYARKLQELSAELNDPVIVMQSKINLGFVLVSAGLFNETLDTLQSISTASLPDSLKSGFYYLIGRTCYDLAEFSRDEFYSSRYTERGNSFLDSGLIYLPEKGERYLILKGLKDLHQEGYDNARQSYEALLENHRLTNSELAIVASTLSFIYNRVGDEEKSKEMLIHAAIADILSSTKETVAIRKLAEMLYHEGNIQKAYAYIQIAMQDANFYGANHRKIQVGSLFPVIEGKQLSYVEARKNLVTVYAVGITLLFLIMIAFGLIIYVQFRKLQVAKKVISDSNEKLIETNHQLVDSNKIKEEYVTYYFNTTADYISRLENLKKTMEMKLMTKKMDDLRFVVDSINIKKERDELYHNFDKVFLKLFPDFVTVFQSLLRKEDQIHIKDGQLLNTELRIFALIRMGINDNEKISKILDYSVTTIYTYKTRIRSKSIVPNDEFDRRIMAIRTI